MLTLAVSLVGVNAMSEFEKIAIGLLGMTHPEVALIRLRAEKAQPRAITTNKSLLYARTRRACIPTLERGFD
jgi:hypothetical protein